MLCENRWKMAKQWKMVNSLLGQSAEWYKINVIVQVCSTGKFWYPTRPPWILHAILARRDRFPCCFALYGAVAKYFRNWTCISRCSGKTATLQVEVWSWSFFAVAGTLSMKSYIFFQYGMSFTDICKNWTTRNDHLDLWFPLFLKIVKKSMSISLGTYEKRGGSTLLQIALTAVRSKLLWFSF